MALYEGNIAQTKTINKAFHKKKRSWLGFKIWNNIKIKTKSLRHFLVFKLYRMCLLLILYQWLFCYLRKLGKWLHTCAKNYLESSCLNLLLVGKKAVGFILNAMKFQHCKVRLKCPILCGVTALATFLQNLKCVAPGTFCCTFHVSHSQ